MSPDQEAEAILFWRAVMRSLLHVWIPIMLIIAGAALSVRALVTQVGPHGIDLMAMGVALLAYSKATREG